MALITISSISTSHLIIIIIIIITFLPVTTSLLLPHHHDCHSIDSLPTPSAKCSYLRTHTPCIPTSYINYLRIFYCTCGAHPLLGLILLSLSLLILFYLLGNTASRYFCSSLHGLSNLLSLPPTLAGVTLLALGNGAPDAFSTVLSFAAGSGGEVGLSIVLGGALFVSTVVVGVIAISLPARSVTHIDRRTFLRDVCSLLAVLCSLLAILLVGRINLLGSTIFTSLYAVYVLLVSLAHCCSNAIKGGDLEAPLLAIGDGDDTTDTLQDLIRCHCIRFLFNQCQYTKFLFDVLGMPLNLPRRLTIPDVEEERWSKPFAVASATLSPVMLAAVWNSKVGDAGISISVFLAGGLIGMILGLTAMVATERGAPPKKCLLPWLAGGFLMSVTWTYILAQELVGLLVSMGHILSISPGVLGVTVMAWGNSAGDLMANVAMAVNEGHDGVQIAVSGCYAGPIFNVLIGLGMSLVLSSWSRYPDPLVIPQDLGHFQTLGFMLVGLLWAAVVLPWRRMRVDRVLGFGLLGIYVCFLCVRMSESIWPVKIRLL